ncbi:MAG: class I SAM-dependent methyltransferase [Planctomycetes bacterium]|nr:class I SAM-dependent methyltransferase [Planctomycetota bacterium]
MIDEGRYPGARELARETGIAAERLVEAFAVEQEFHARVMAEPDPTARRALYEEVYPRVHAIYGQRPADPHAPNPKDPYARLFARELSGASLLEVGCGAGAFLLSVARLLDPGELVGLDVSEASFPPSPPAGVRFVAGDVIDFSADQLGRESFDVVYSDNVLEHLAPQDLATHFDSIERVLRPGGLLILLLPNRLFGPTDVTRVLDCSYSNRVPSQGTHLTESTYSELVPLLRRRGYRDLKTVLPVPGIKDRLPFRHLRFDPRWLQAIERNPLALGLMHRVRWRGKCMARFGVTLLARKG